MSHDLDELAGVVDLLAAVAELDDPQLFPPVVLRKLAAIVPCDILIYNELVVGTANVRWMVQRAGDDTPRLIPVAATREMHREMHREMRSLRRYNEYIKAVGVEFQIALTWRAPAQTLIGIALNRSRCDFSDRERDVVTLLRAPLATSFERLAHRARTTTMLPSPGVDALTDRELQVLELVAAGRTDAAIGHLLGCSRRTVGKHLENIYRKLGVTNRVAAIARIRERAG